MTDPIAAIDVLLAQWLPPLVRALCWGAASGALSMAMYARISPQKKLLALKSAQQTTRQAMLAHDGDMKELLTLIRKDMATALRPIALAVPAFLLSALPVALLMYFLLPLYPGALTGFGPEWTQGFEFWYIATMIVSSLAVKTLFKIA